MASDAPSARPTAADARAALDGLDADGARLAEHVVTPWWYHLALGLIVATFALAQALPGPGVVILIALSIVAIPVLVLAYRRLYGVTLVEPAGPRSRRALVASIGVMVIVFAASLAIKVTDAGPWWALLPAAAGFVATIVVGRRYDAVLREELAARSDARS